MNIQKNEISNIGYNYLVNNGIFYVKNFIENEQLINDIYDKVEEYVNKIDKNVTKKYENYFVESKESMIGSNKLHERNKTTFNFRGIVKDKIFNKNKTYTSDTGFCDIIPAELLFSEIKKINFNKIFDLCKKIKPDFNKDKDIMYNLYYTNSVVDTRTWHRDGNIIKFFIYLQDVEIEHGPYSYVTNSSKMLLDKTIQGTGVFMPEYFGTDSSIIGRIIEDFKDKGISINRF